MPRNYSSKEASQLIQAHKSLLKTLDGIVGISQTLQQEIYYAEDQIRYQLNQEVLCEVESGTKRMMPSEDTKRFIASLYRYQKSLAIASLAKHCQEKYQPQIQACLSQLLPRTNGLRWMFARASTKTTADAAYETLQDMLHGVYSQRVQSLKEYTEVLHNTPLHTIWDDFCANREDYKKLYHKLDRAPEYAHKHINPFSDLINKQVELKQKIDCCTTGVETEQDQIKLAAEKLALAESFSMLKNIPVEELNRDRSGIRVKTLREHGFATLADVYTASIYELASLHGISDDGAYTIKHRAQEFAEQARNTAKIRLSQDHRTKEATELVISVYQHRSRNQKRHALHDLVSSCTDTITSSINILQKLNNPLEWLFYSEAEKVRLRNAYTVLKQHLTGEYAQKANQYISDLSPTKHYTSDDAWEDFSQNSVSYFNILENIIPGILGNDDSLYGLPEDLAREIQDQSFFPDGLLCELRRYQEWGVKYALHQERVLLGDEMGLGKTVQAIATMVSLRNTGATHFMVVCPASVLTNWCREIRKMSRLPVTKVHGSDRYTAARSWIKTGGVAVTTYETTGHIALKQDFKFSMLVVDEAHYIKNPDAQRTINVKKISEHADRLLFMTGTALENKVDEMIALIKILQPPVADSVRGMEFLSSAPEFRKKVAPVYYRRKREDVLTELPDLIENREWCTMTPAEEAVYEEAVLNKKYTDARRVSWNAPNLNESSKARRMMDLIADAKSEDRKVIVFSFFLDTISKVKMLVGKQCFGPINGSVTPQRRQEIIDEFDKAPAGAVLAAQIQAGGTGLNIQSASVVIICEPQFKPSIENQAISRAYRMGQTRNVLVYRLLCEDTVDERITTILENKQTIFDAFADKSEAATQSMELDDKTFGNIIKEEIDRINAKRGSPAIR